MKVWEKKTEGKKAERKGTEEREIEEKETEEQDRQRKKEKRRRRKEQKAVFLNIIEKVLYLMPLILGTYGYLKIAPSQYLDSIYNAISLYGGDCKAEELNIWLEIARWWGVLVMASFVVLLIRPLRETLTRFWIAVTGGTIIYGSGDNAERLAEDIELEDGGLFPAVLVTQDRKVSPAEHHVIMCGSGGENFLFYEANREQFGKGQVHVNVETVHPVGTTPETVNAFSISENIARLYWKKYPIFLCQGEDRSVKKEIGLIGFGNLGQNLLSCGILQNIYDKNQSIVYHIWDWEGNEFRFQHKVLCSEEKDKENTPLFLDGTGDYIVFHEEFWQSPEELSKIKKLDRLILCKDHGNYKNLEALLYELTPMEARKIGRNAPEIHVKLGKGGEYSVAADVKDEIRFFGDVNEVVTKECIIQESLLKEAKRLNYQYVLEKEQGKNLGVNQELTKKHEKQMEAEWDNLGSFFMRCSNIAAADYISVLDQLLLEIILSSQSVTEKDLERLAELEHIRWCRFYWWNNWEYGDGTEKSSAVRRHWCLKPYQQLSKEEKQYNLDRVIDRLEKHKYRVRN